MKGKDIEFDAEELVGSVEAFAAQLRKGKTGTLRTHKLSVPALIEPPRPKGYWCDTPHSLRPARKQPRTL